jgi:cytochrome c553
MADNHRARRRTTSVPVGFAVLALGIAGCSGTGSETAGVHDSAVAGTLHVCSACHGLGGHSISPIFPRLAGQHKEYVILQLDAFRDKTRADPPALTYMWGMAAPLSDQAVAAIAAYYAAQVPAAGEPGHSPETIAGRKIFTEGAGNVPACMACHGAKAQGDGSTPRLAGQHPAYLARELQAFASKERANEVMGEVSQSLSPDQIADLTAFIATQ